MAKRSLIPGKVQRIKVVWCEGKGVAFYDDVADAYEQVATLTSAGFFDAEIDWLNSRC